MVVLMLGGLEGLGLDENRAFEADAVLVLDHHATGIAVLIQLAAQIGVQQRVVALAPAPEHVVLAAQPVRRFQAVAHLRGRPGIDLRIGTGGRAAGVARMAEQIGRAPQQLDAGGRHLRGHAVFDLAQIPLVLLEGAAVAIASTS